MRQNWIDSLVDECSHVETPKSWLWYSFLSCISAAAGNNYYLATLKGDLIYKPNLYIMLLGESGLGKGFPVNRAKLLVNKAGVTRVIAGRSSIQAIIKELATTRSAEGKAPIQDSRGFIVNGELSTAIIADPDSMTILTDLYDGSYNPEWTNLLKGDGAEKLKNPYITALFGSSPAHFYDSIPQANIEGGYIGRNLLVYEEKRSQNVDLFNDDKETNETKFDDLIAPKYVPHLEHIAKNKGQLAPNDEARKMFNTWRKKWRETQPPDKTGFLNRVPDHVLKVSMCLCLADWEFTGEIRESHLVEGIEKVTSLIYANKKTTSGRGQDPLAAATKLVIDYLLAAQEQKLTKKQLLWKGYGEYNTFTLDQILDNLVEMGWVKKIKAGIGSNSDWEVRLSGEPLDAYKVYLKRKGQE
jgi:hypothetical protein